MANTPVMDRLANAAARELVVADTVDARQVAYAVIAELVQAADELEEARELQPMTTESADRYPRLSHLVDLFAGGGQFVQQPERAKIGAGLVRVLERLLGEPDAVRLTILGKSGWQETALRVLLEEARQQLEERTGDAEALPKYPVDAVRDALFALGDKVHSRTEALAAAGTVARAISQLAKEHADDAYRSHLAVGHVRQVQ